MNTLLALGQNAFEWTWKTSASAALLVALVFLAQKILSRWLTARLRYMLSLLVLIRLIFPMAPPSPLSLENLFPSAAPGIESSLHPPPAGQFIKEASPAQRASVSPALAIDLPLLPAPQLPGLSMRAGLSLVWVSGFVFLIVVAGWRYRQWTRLIAKGQPVSDPHLLQLLDSARQDMGVRRSVKLVQVAQLRTPAVAGIWKVCVLLPQNVASQLDAQELRMVFLHEMAHVRRHDVVLNFLLIGVQFLHWFNPLVWLANHWIRADRELVCDAMTMSRLAAAERSRYGQVLLKLLESISAETPVFPGLVPVVGSKKEVKRRLIMIKQQRRGSVAASLATALAVMVAACCTFTRSQAGPSQASNAGGPEAPAAVSLQAASSKPNTAFRLSSDNNIAGADFVEADSVEGQLRSERLTWQRAPGPIQAGIYVQDILFGRLDQPTGRGTIGKVLSVDEYIGMEHAWVDFGRGCVEHIRTSELRPIRTSRTEIAAADSVEGQLRSEGKSWDAVPGPIQTGSYVQDTLLGRLDQPIGRGTIGKVTSVDEYIGMEHAWVDFGRDCVEHIRTSELCPIQIGTSPIGTPKAAPTLK